MVDKSEPELTDEEKEKLAAEIKLEAQRIREVLDNRPTRLLLGNLRDGIL